MFISENYPKLASEDQGYSIAKVVSCKLTVFAKLQQVGVLKTSSFLPFSLGKMKNDRIAA